ncbi:hypothetical protein ETB97_010012 [Aspergillus alliaceus]|uniref:Uncharacterized protein n=1 Tax=Petromyces alliaceus TaxID=209559 RepID=A0A8H6AAH5_PETAA|nr:hypothetical protein ETB97_010012 [Aspergillus burnettii]
MSTLHPVRLLYENEQEAHYAQLFLDHVLCVMSGYSTRPAWRSLMVQAVHEEVAVRHVAIAVSAVLYEKSATPVSAISSPLWKHGDENRRFSLTRYGKGLSALRKMMCCKDHRSVEVTLICGALCIWFELIAGEPLIALNHLDQCLKIISGSGGKLDPSISYTFSKLDLQAATYIGRRPPAIVATDMKPIPYIFDFFDEAEQCLLEEYNRIYSFKRTVAARYRYLGPDWIPMELLAYVQLLRDRLEHWESTYKFSYACQKAEGTPQLAQRVTLLFINYHTALITVSTCLYPEETIYDRFLSSFQQILSLAKVLIEGYFAQRHQNWPGFSLDMGVIQPLYMTATKCRNSDVRQHAIDLLSSAPVIEGVWDGRTTALVSRRAKELEEEGLERATDGIPEYRRIHSIGLDVNAELHQIEIAFRRRLNGFDGEWNDTIEIHSLP